MKPRKLPSGSYRVEKMYKGKRYSATFPYKPTQKEIMQAFADLLDNEQDKVQDNGSFESKALEYFTIKENILSVTTVRGYSSCLRNLSSNFKSTNLSDITQVDIQREINNYAKNHAPKSTYNMNGFISVIMEEFRPKFQYKISLPQKVENPDYIPTDEEVKRILEAVKGSEYEIPILLSMAGLRRSETCAITKADLSDDNLLTINKAYVQDKNNQWHIKPYPKNESSCRTIPIIPYLAELIRSAPVEDNERIYKRYPSKIYYELHKQCNALGIQRFRLHTCRAYYISMCHAIGIPDQYIMANSGHKTDHTLKKVYRRTKSDTQQEMDAKMLNKMESFFDT